MLALRWRPGRPVGEALVGPLAEVLGLRRVLLGCAALIVAAMLAPLAEPSVRALRSTA